MCKDDQCKNLDQEASASGSVDDEDESDDDGAECDSDVMPINET